MSSELVHRKSLTRPEFKEWTKYDHFIEYKEFLRDIFRIELKESFLKVAVQKTDEGVQIVYLDSKYDSIEDKLKLISYATFVIAYRKNKNRGFETVTFEEA